LGATTDPLHKDCWYAAFCKKNFWGRPTDPATRAKGAGFKEDRRRGWYSIPPGSNVSRQERGPRWGASFRPGVGPGRGRATRENLFPLTRPQGAMAADFIFDRRSAPGGKKESPMSCRISASAGNAQTRSEKMEGRPLCIFSRPASRLKVGHSFRKFKKFSGGRASSTFVWFDASGERHQLSAVRPTGDSGKPGNNRKKSEILPSSGPALSPSSA